MNIANSNCKGNSNEFNEYKQSTLIRNKAENAEKRRLKAIK